MSWANQYPVMWAQVMQDGRCQFCAAPGAWPRVYFLAGEPAVWASACRGHRTELGLVA